MQDQLHSYLATHKWIFLLLAKAVCSRSVSTVTNHLRIHLSETALCMYVKSITLYSVCMQTVVCALQLWIYCASYVHFLQGVCLHACVWVGGGIFGQWKSNLPCQLIGLHISACCMYAVCMCKVFACFCLCLCVVVFQHVYAHPR